MWHNGRWRHNWKSTHVVSSHLVCDPTICGNRVSTSLGNSGLCWTVFAHNGDTVVPAEENGDLQTLICVLVARPRRCLTLSNPVPWQNWMVAYLGYTLWMKTLFRGWPVMVHDTHTRKRRMVIWIFVTYYCTPEPQSRSFHVLANLHQNRFSCFQNIVFSSLIMGEWTDRRTDGQTDDIMPLHASLVSWRQWCSQGQGRDLNPQGQGLNLRGQNHRSQGQNLQAYDHSRN